MPDAAQGRLVYRPPCSAGPWLSLVSRAHLLTTPLPTPGLLSALPMFGSSFFFIQSCSHIAVPAPCILAVNQNGLNFLSTENHVSGLSLALPLAPFSFDPTPSKGLRSLGCGSPAPPLTTCVTLDKSLPLSEPHLI